MERIRCFVELRQISLVIYSSDFKMKRQVDSPKFLKEFANECVIHFSSLQFVEQRTRSKEVTHFLISFVAFRELQSTSHGRSRADQPKHYSGSNNRVMGYLGK